MPCSFYYVAGQDHRLTRWVIIILCGLRALACAGESRHVDWSDLLLACVCASSCPRPRMARRAFAVLCPVKPLCHLQQKTSAGAEQAQLDAIDDDPKTIGKIPMAV